MEAYQERVVEEQAELNEKIEKLGAFLQNSAIDEIPNEERERLARQKTVMEEYSSILGERILAFA